MNRPSRRLRESATTTLKNGRFLAPPRASLITTMAKVPVEPRKKTLIIRRNPRWPQSRVRRRGGRSAQAGEGAFQPPHHLLDTTFGDHFHHFLCLLELGEQAIDFLHRGAGAGRDPPLARR